MQGEPKSSTATYLTLGIILTLGLYLRVSGLSTLGLGFDEPIHIYAAKSLLETGTPTLPSGIEYRRAFLFTSLVALSFKLFGVSALSARLPSVIFGLLSILLVYRIGRSFFGPRVGLIAALLVAFVPYEVAWSRACRMYSMYQFFYLATFYCFYLAFEGAHFRTKESNWWSKLPAGDVSAQVIYRSFRLVVCGVLFAITFKLQSLAVVLPLSILSYLLIMFGVELVYEADFSLLKSKYFLASSSILVLSVAALLVPEIRYTLVGMYHYSPQWNEAQGTSPTLYFRYFIGPMLFPILVFFVTGTMELIAKFSKPGLYTVAVVAVPLTIHSFLVNVQGWRYIYDVFPMTLLVASFGICSLWVSIIDKLRNRLNSLRFSASMRSRTHLLVVSFLLLIFSVPFTYTVYGAIKLSRNKVGHYGGEYHANWNKACRFLRNAQEQGDVVVASIPIAAMFSGCGDIQYKLDNGGLEQFRRIQGNRMLLDVFSNAKAITDLDEFKRVLSENPHGWLLIDAQRFVNPSTVPPQVRTFIENNLACRSRTDETVLIFRWQSGFLSKNNPPDRPEPRFLSTK